MDRLAVRERPTGAPVLHQRWNRLVFLHWHVSPNRLRPLVHPGLELDLFEGKAWVGVTAFTVTRMRPHLCPPMPGVSDTHQVNLRTYVHCEGVPGLWFFSLDATNALAVWGARLAYHLPYFLARIDVTEQGRRVCFDLERTHPNSTTASFSAVWQVAEPMPRPQPGTIEFFLIERYVLYAASDARLWRARIHHRPWPLKRATLECLHSTLLEAQGVPTENGPPLVHAQAQPFDVDIWWPRRVSA